MRYQIGRADLHVHTHHSDGAPSVRQVLDRVAVAGLDVVAITDHDTIAGALEAQRIMRDRPYAFEVVVGEEVSTRDGHLVGLYLQERIPPGLDARETVAEIRAQGGLAFAPHPFFGSRQREGRPITMIGLGDHIADLALDAVETINATPFLRQANRRAARYNRSVTRLPELGNSDGHILAALGKGFTTFPGRTADDLRTAIERGHTAAHAHSYSARELLAYLHFWLGLQWRGRVTARPTGTVQRAIG